MDNREVVVQAYNSFITKTPEAFRAKRTRLVQYEAYVTRNFQNIYDIEMDEDITVFVTESYSFKIKPNVLCRDYTTVSGKPLSMKMLNKKWRESPYIKVKYKGDEGGIENARRLALVIPATFMTYTGKPTHAKVEMEARTVQEYPIDAFQVMFDMTPYKDITNYLRNLDSYIMTKLSGYTVNSELTKEELVKAYVAKSLEAVKPSNIINYIVSKHRYDFIGSSEFNDTTVVMEEALSFYENEGIIRGYDFKDRTRLLSTKINHEYDIYPRNNTLKLRLELDGPAHEVRLYKGDEDKPVHIEKHLNKTTVAALMHGILSYCDEEAYKQQLYEKGLSKADARLQNKDVVVSVNYTE